MVGHQLAQPVHLAIAHLQDAPGIAQHRAGLQFAESDDLGDVIAAIFGLNIADHFAAPGFAEVDVEVRHRDAFGIEEAFEQQPEFQRIEIGDGQSPGDHRARTRTAPRPHRNILFLGPFDEIGHDQEVAAETHAVDHVDFEFEAVGVGLKLIPTPLSLSLSKASRLASPSAPSASTSSARAALG